MSMQGMWLQIWQLNIKSKLTEKSDYVNGLILSKDDILMFTDGSKSTKGAGCGVCSEQLNLNISLKLLDAAEIMAI